MPTSVEKKRVKVIVVKAGTFEDLAKKMQRVQNKLMNQGYNPTFEPIHEHVHKDGSGSIGGYIIHATLQVGQSTLSSLLDIPFSSEEPSGLDQGQGSESSETSRFIQAAFQKISVQDWGIAIKELPAIVPTILTGFTTTELANIAKELEDDCSRHSKDHFNTCNVHKAYSVIATTIREALRTSIQ